MMIILPTPLQAPFVELFRTLTLQALDVSSAKFLWHLALTWHSIGLRYDKLFRSPHDVCVNRRMNFRYSTL